MYRPGPTRWVFQACPSFPKAVPPFTQTHNGADESFEAARGGRQLISIRKATDELDRLEELLMVVASAYGNSIKSAGQYVVECDPLEASHFQEHIGGIKTKADRAATAEDWQSVGAAFRGELRDYRDKAIGRIQKMRSDLKAAASAMEIFATSVAASGADHKEHLEGALSQLHSTATSNDLGRIRVIVETATQTIATSFEKMEKEHTAVIVQLRDELRLLHEQRDAERRAAFLDRATGVWNRQKIDSNVDELLSRDESFCILMVCLRNLPRLETQHSRTVIEGAIKALLQRFSAMTGEDAMIGRWSKEAFAAILQIDAAVAIGVSREVSKQLTGTYAVQENGLAESVSLQTVGGVIDRASGTDASSFQQKLLQMADALKNA